MAKTKTKPRTDAYQAVTDRIIDLIEDGIATGEGWMQPWKEAVGAGLPHNGVSKRAYRGVNVMLLWAEAQLNGWPLNILATYNQWQSVGAQVRKDEESTRVILFKKIRVRADEDQEADEDGKRTILLDRIYRVFNVAQVDGWEPPPPPPKVDLDEEREAFIAATGADVDVAAGNRAMYLNEPIDRVTMPEPGQFGDLDRYYATVFHELTHWTGAKPRLDRDLSGRFGNEAYAMEELVAELGSAFVCADFGIEPTEKEENAEYVANWLQVLRDDKKAIVTAASKAADAAKYLHTGEAPNYDEGGSG